MAVIDSLLKLIETRMASGLLVLPDQAPLLLKGGEQIPLTMPPVPASYVESFLGDALGTNWREKLDRDDPVEGDYTFPDSGEFNFSIANVDGGYRIEFRPFDSTQVEIVESTVETRESSGFAKDMIDEFSSRAQGCLEIDPELLSVIDRGLARGASDIFFSSGQSPRFRVNGEVESTTRPSTTEDQVTSLASLGGSAGLAKEFANNKQADFGIELQTGTSRLRFRVSLFKHRSGAAATLRPIRNRIPTFEELNLPGDIKKLGDYPNGLILITGAAGSGKSTTLASIVEYVNQNKPRHIITLEDPVEFEYQNKRSIIHQREVGRDVTSFSEGLRGALRESPDVILLGEMRELVTIEAALTSAETGHLVLSTLHTRDAPSAIERIIDVFPGEKQPQIRLQLAGCLRAVVTQKLVPSANRPGRVPAIERMIANSAVSHLIRDGKDHQIQSQIQSGGAEEMITFERSLSTLVRSGKITEKTAFSAAPDELSLRKLLS